MILKNYFSKRLSNMPLIFLKIKTILLCSSMKTWFSFFFFYFSIFIFIFIFYFLPISFSFPTLFQKRKKKKNPQLGVWGGLSIFDRVSVHDQSPLLVQTIPLHASSFYWVNSMFNHYVWSPTNHNPRQNDQENFPHETVGKLRLVNRIQTITKENDCLPL